LFLLGIITFQPAAPEILLQFSHRNDVPGALTGRLVCVPRQPARQIASNESYPAAHSSDLSKIPRLHKDVPPLQFQKGPFSASIFIHRAAPAILARVA
jgi:hypothetical protein